MRWLEVSPKHTYRRLSIGKHIDDSVKAFCRIHDKMPEYITDKLAQKACKSAIKAGQKLSQAEIDKLLELLKGNMALKCPHGRPVAVKITETEIDKWFKRIV